MTFNPTLLQPQCRHPVTGEVMWIYITQADTVAEILADGYFTSQGTGLGVNHGIVVIGSDGIRIIRVLSVAGDGSVNTAGGFFADEDIQIDSNVSPILPDIGGGSSPANLREELELIHRRLNLKGQRVNNIGTGVSLFIGSENDPDEPSAKVFNFRRIRAGTGIEIVPGEDNSLIINAIGGSGGGGPGGGGGGTGEATFGGPFHPLNIPVTVGLPTHPQSNQLLDQVFGIVPGRFNLNPFTFSPAVYFDDQAGGATAVLVASGQSNLPSGTRVPWNPSVMETPGDFNPDDSDSYVLIINRQTGRCFETYQTRYFASNNQLRCTNARVIKAGIELNDSANGNVFLKENCFRVSRGCGIQHCMGLILRKEIDAGVVPHANGIIWSNPTQGDFRAPALKGIGSANGGGANRGFMGLRIVWDGLSNADINNWLNGEAAPVRGMLQAIGISARDYGAIGTDHGGFPPLRRGGFGQVEHTVTAKWDQIGVTSGNVLTSLHRLFEPNLGKARVIAIPTYPGGNSATRAEYPGIDYPPFQLHTAPL